MVDFLDKRMESGAKGYDVIVYHRGKEVFRHKNGLIDIEKELPVRGDELYYLYSCSKPITCTAAMQLFEKGAFSLDDKLSDYMPEFAQMTIKDANGERKAEKPILIRHLFEMSAGFDYELASDEEFKACAKATDGRCPTREAMKYLARRPIAFEPGTRWRYSLCHDVLAAFVEVVSGERFSDYVKKNIFDPMGMHRSTYRLTEDVRAQVAPIYIYDETSKSPKLLKIGISDFVIGSEYESGGAGCVSCTEDYIRFLEGVRTFKLLKKETVDLMRENHITAYGIDDTPYWKKETHGYGLGVRCDNRALVSARNRIAVAELTHIKNSGAFVIFKSVIKHQRVIVPIVWSAQSYGDKPEPVALGGADKASPACFCKAGFYADSSVV